MRLIWACVLCVLLAATADAAPACNGSTDLIQVTSWAIQPIDTETNTLTVTLRNMGSKAIRMIEGSVGFIDALGGPIANYRIDRDAKIPAGGTFEESGRWGRFTFERLLTLKRDEVTPFACVAAVLYDDGTKDEF